jgi:MoaA/NifB/PqqE/SkfB family radical SAM enzyme
MVTGRCSCRCQFCPCWETGPEAAASELPPEVWVETVRRLQELTTVDSVVLGGGEPLLYRGLEHVLRGLDRLGASPGVITNGQLLDADWVQRLLSAGTGWINLSLDGPEQIHDELRGVPGLFRRVVRGVELIKQARPDLRVCLSTVICRQNLAQLPAFVSWALGETAADGINFQAYTQVTEQQGPRWWKDSPLWPADAGAVQEVMDELRAIKAGGAAIVNPDEQLDKYVAYFQDPDQELEIRCLAGSMNFTVSPSGDVRGCIAEQPVGNIAEDDPVEIYMRGFAPARYLAASCPASCHFRINCFFPERWREWLEQGGDRLQEQDRRALAAGGGAIKGLAAAPALPLELAGAEARGGDAGGEPRRYLPADYVSDTATVFFCGHNAEVHRWGVELDDLDFDRQLAALGRLGVEGLPHHILVGVRRTNFHRLPAILQRIRQVRDWGGDLGPPFPVTPLSSVRARFQEHLQAATAAAAEWGIELRVVDERLDDLLQVIEGLAPGELGVQQEDLLRALGPVCKDVLTGPRWLEFCGVPEAGDGQPPTFPAQLARAVLDQRAGMPEVQSIRISAAGGGGGPAADSGGGGADAGQGPLPVPHGGCFIGWHTSLVLPGGEIAICNPTKVIGRLTDGAGFADFWRGQVAARYRNGGLVMHRQNPLTLTGTPLADRRCGACPHRFENRWMADLLAHCGLASFVER